MENTIRFINFTLFSQGNMITTYSLNHLGIVASICKDLKIANIIDTLIPSDPQQKVTTGQSVIAMIINGLGFSNRSLYLFPQFFEKKPVNLLIAKEITPYSLNDDTIGRALDRLFNYGCTELFSSIAHIAANSVGVDKKFGHLDTTTISVHGEYKSSNNNDAAIHITYGKSKMRRPDLKQIFLNLVVSSDGGVPLFMQTLNGNSSDSIIFRKTVTDFRRGLKKNLQEITYWIADSKFYSDETIRATIDDVLWISRVPDNITEARDIIENTASSLDELLPLNVGGGYSYRQQESTYGDVVQRWLVVHSEQAENRVRDTVERAVNKEYEKLQKKAKKLHRKKFYCEPDARDSISSLQKESKYHTISIDEIVKTEKYKGRGRPSKTTKKEKIITYFPRTLITTYKEVINLEIKKKAIFIIATNELSEKKLTDQEVFENYKGQQTVEKGFRFLKDPLFFLSSLFLKKPERIVALTMVMCLSLLVYSICERKLRMVLKEQKKSIMNQVGKPTQIPTLRWIFQLFEDVHLIKIEENEEVRYEVKNLRPDGITVLNILGGEYMAQYLLA